MTIQATIEAYQTACQHLRMAIAEPPHLVKIETAEKAVIALEGRIIAAHPADASELLSKLEFVEQLVGSAIGSDVPGQSWFSSLRRDVRVLLSN